VNAAIPCKKAEQSASILYGQIRIAHDWAVASSVSRQVEQKFPSKSFENPWIFNKLRFMKKSKSSEGILLFRIERLCVRHG